MLTSAPATAPAEFKPPAVIVSGDDAPVKRLDPDDLRNLGQKLDRLFMQYRADRRIAELRWLRNERQYLGIYDPETEKELSPNRSKAYPRVTRTKCISVLSRIMSLMFPGNEKNWEIKASPSPDLTKEEIQQAVLNQQTKDKAAGQTPELTIPYLMSAMVTFAQDQADELSVVIEDQLEELGGDQSYDYIQLNRKAVRSGIIYGLGLLQGPYAREATKKSWTISKDGTPQPVSQKVYMPEFHWLPIWNFYPDMSAKTLHSMDGYFTREVMSRSQLRKLADRTDFFGDVIKKYLGTREIGNYRPLEFEIELRAMGVKVNVNEMKIETTKYEVLVWHGMTSGGDLRLAGIDVPDDKLTDQMDAEIWMVEGNVIKATLNPWESLGVDVKMLHHFLFDEDDTSPVGFGLPNAIRDTQMAISAATRMLLDNASVTCGPQLELNTDLLRPDQDLTSTGAYKIWYREGSGPDAQFPAVKNVAIDAHLGDLLKIIELFQKNADMETFVGPATGGDMTQSASEPMRTAAGASMIRGDQALPFKDIIRSFDHMTQSVLESIVRFNQKMNPDLAPKADFNVVARGATSLVAKEVRGLQIDQLAASLTPTDQIYVDGRKMFKARLDVRDMGDLMVSKDESDRREKSQADAQQKTQDQQDELMKANIRKTLSDAFKNIAQANKNAASGDATAVNTALQVLEHALLGGPGGGMDGTQSPEAAGPGASQDAQPDEGGGGDGGDAPAAPQAAGGLPAGAGGMPPVGAG